MIFFGASRVGWYFGTMNGFFDTSSCRGIFLSEAFSGADWLVSAQQVTLVCSTSQKYD
jgi:hypothetical protein